MTDTVKGNPMFPKTEGITPPDWVLLEAAKRSEWTGHSMDHLRDVWRNPLLYLGGNPYRALCRAIEQHEAFRQEVSDAVVKATHTMAAGKLVEASGILAAFIIPKPVDPLVEVIADYKRTKGTGEYATNKDMAAALRAALAARGLEVRKIGEKAGE